MDEYTNSARRLQVIIEKIQTIPESMPMVQAWSTVLGLDIEISKDDPHEVQEKLGLIRNEINLIQRLMADKPFSKGLYIPHLENIRRIVSVSNLDAAWGNYRNRLPNETLLSLRFCVEIIPPEAALPTSDLEILLDLVMEARKEIEDSSFSPLVREFLLRHLSIIEEGIRDYPISGGSAITNAFHEGFRTASSADPGNDAKDKAGYSKVMTVWKALWDRSKDVVHVDQIMRLIGTSIEQGRPIVQWLITAQ
ncbi:hypothetical protein EBAPG3_009375 [Nitrosospira lacus]|uniref:Uncharacterized protein n=1 Tax=Nitrosospira lacus TaxID=1288494 RepID=A0A1W6SQ73_9PROT|nr:hypothetical protein [Nitrosospira lacus]ARO87960.1 hypothetical protein EBAPG3_009375 [Nitrosospira lacus]